MKKVVIIILSVSLLSCKEKLIKDCPENLSVDCYGLTEKECQELVRKTEKQICEDGGIKSRSYTEEEMLCLGIPTTLYHKDEKGVTEKMEDFWECTSYINDKGHPKNKVEWHQYLIRKMKDESTVAFTTEEISKFQEGELEDFRWMEKYFKGRIKGYLQKHNVPYQDSEYSKTIEPLKWPPPPQTSKEYLEQYASPREKKELKSQ